MTVVAVEAVPAIESTAAGAAGGSAGGTGAAAARTGGRTSQGRVPSPSQGQRGSFRPSSQSPPSSGGGAPRKGGRTQQGARQQARSGGRTQQGGGNVTPTQVTATDSKGGTQTVTLPDSSLPAESWHRWIMAEFVLAVILVGASPFVKPGGVAGKDTPSLAGPLVRLTAVSLIYFILALIAQGPRSGKIAAAFGGLVLLGTAFNSLPLFTTVTAVFTPKGKPGDQSGLGQSGPGTSAGGKAEPEQPS